MELLETLRQAHQRRRELIERWEAEGTDSYRLFHGVSEGRPGLSVDRYGSLLLAQVSSTLALSDPERGALAAYLAETGGPAVIAWRQGPRLSLDEESLPGLWSSTFWCRELGLEFAINLEAAHRDPQLFLDFRAAKRALLASLAALPQPLSLLNLFAYTCSVSCHCAGAGVQEVWSVDFSAGNLAWGRKNFRRNRLNGHPEFLTEDCLGVLWALTGRKARRGRQPRIQPRQFSLVVADPPAWSKGKFAAVDMVRDPETVLGPAWEAVAPGGVLLAANNTAKVPRAEFETRLLKLLGKRGGLQNIRWILPDQDFPSFDGEPPLKVALCRKE